MVSFKRKTVRIPGPENKPTDSSGNVDPNARVWFIDKTGEYFMDYDKYLSRLDFYNQKKFISELTGHSCLTFFEAQERETQEARSVAVDFPESTKGPILEMIQFNVNSRLDQLVDEVYSRIKQQFFVGELLHARTKEQQRVKVKVIEVIPQGDHKLYRCEVLNNSKDILEFEAADLFRDRRVFNKMSVRTFIKFAASREPWAGCPWIVKPDYAAKYHISTEMPAELQRHIVTRKRLLEEEELESSTPEPSKRLRKVNKSVPTRPSDDLLDIASVSWNEQELKAMCEWPKAKTQEPAPLMGKLLHLWAFLNVYNEMLILDPIPFDAFIRDLQNPDSLMTAEIICAIFTIYVDQDEDILAIPFPSQYEPVKRRKRGRRKVKESEEENEVEEQEEEEDGEQSNHSAEQYLDYDDINWMERIGRRMFTNGGWQLLMVCTLYEASYMKEWQETIEPLLVTLAPQKASVSARTAEKGWRKLTLGQRLDALTIISQILYNSPGLRRFIDQRSENSTKIRKERAEVTREQKSCQENIRLLKEKRALIAAERADAEDLNKVKEYADLDKQVQNEIQKSEKLLAKIASLSRELAHYDCQRFKLIGKDRFYNQYWWMESNGLPVSTSESPQDIPPLMGRIWVQGPTEEDMKNHIDNEEVNAQYGAARAANYRQSYYAEIRELEEKRRRQALAKKRAEEAQKRREDAEAAYKQSHTEHGSVQFPRYNQHYSIQEMSFGAVTGDQQHAQGQPQVSIPPQVPPSKPQTPGLTPHSQVGTPQKPVTPQGPQPIYPTMPQQMYQMQVPMPQQMPYSPQVRYPVYPQFPQVPMVPQNMTQFPPQVVYMIPQMNGMNMFSGAMPPGFMAPQQVPMGAFPVRADGHYQQPFVHPYPLQFPQAGGAQPPPPMPAQAPTPDASRSTPKPQDTPLTSGNESNGIQTPKKELSHELEASPTKSVVSDKGNGIRSEKVDGASESPSAAKTESPRDSQRTVSESTEEAKHDKVNDKEKVQIPQCDGIPFVLPKEEPKEKQHGASESLEAGGSPKKVQVPQCDGLPFVPPKEELKEKQNGASESLEATVSPERSPISPQKTSRAQPNLEERGPAKKPKLESQTPEPRSMTATPTLSEDRNEDTEEDVPQMVDLPPFSVLELKKLIEKDSLLMTPDDWRYYDSESDFVQLHRYLIRSGFRESSLSDKLMKLEPAIYESFRARHDWLEDFDNYKWTNKAAVKALGHMHSQKPRKRR